MIPGGGVVANGVYVFNGISFLEGTTGMWFYSGYCYEVQYLGSGFSTYPTAFNEADISLSIANSCSSSDCAACSIDIPPSYSVYNCCDASVVVNLNVNITSCSAFDGTWVYEGDGYSTEAGFVFTPGDCYNFTRIEEGVYENAPDCTDFDISTRSCAEAQADGDCPACDLGLQFLAFKPCCGGPIIYFRGNDATAYYGIREYLGTPVDGLENICYSIEIFNVGDSPIFSVSAYNALSFPPAYIEGVTFSTISIFSTDCEDFTESCPSCFPPQCYTLYNCAGESFNTTIDLSIYPVNSWLTIANYLGVQSGPWLVTETIGECNDAVNTISVVGGGIPCTSKCYSVTGEGEVTYIDENYDVVTVYSPAQFCSYIYPTVSPGISVITGTACVNLGEGLECPVYCYTLENCDTGDTIESNTQLLNQYYIGSDNIVTLNGYEGCWIVSDRTTNACECPVPVTVLTSFASCEECLPTISYQFTNCENPALVLYSSGNYADVVGLSVVLDCDTNCWFVTQLDVPAPVESSITILAQYDNCVECLRKYYRLRDCQGIQDDVYTYTNLLTYVGDVIKIKGCDTCWQVTSVPFLPDGVTAEIVSFESTYNDCVTCLASAPCVCSRITNTSSVTVSYEYIDCNGLVVNLRPLDPGQTSNKVCLIAWSNFAQDNAYIEYFGDCTETDGRFACPIVKYPPRIVKPGYNTPTCDTEKWDKITCKSSEILYKMVLKARYGISNCCDAPDDKWLIKKELIDLAALVDPNYVCAVSSCGCTTDTCGCGCSSTPKTCNSN
jgi:hypothetical protein